MIRKHAVSILVLLFWGVPSVFAQVGTSSITGTVADATGAVVASVKELVARTEHFVRTYNAQANSFIRIATIDSILQKIERLCEYISGTQR